MDQAKAREQLHPNKGPNFLLIVVLSAIFILFTLGCVVFLLKERARKMVPHQPTREPNATLSQPAGGLRQTLERS